MSVEVQRDPLERTKSGCRAWLRWQDPEKDADMAVKVASYGDSHARDGEKAPIMALREAQYHFSALQLPQMQRNAAFWRRQHRQDGVIGNLLWAEHPSEWSQFVEMCPFEPIRALMVVIAGEMAEILGPDAF